MSANPALLPAPRDQVLRKAREIIDANPGASLIETVALAYLEGRIDACQELRPSTVRPGLHEFDCVCQRCGSRAGSRFVVDSDAPKEGFFRVVCDRCTSGYDTRAA